MNKKNKKKFIEKDVRVKTSIKGEDVEVIVPALVCPETNEQKMTSSQMNFLRKAAADEYRKNSDLLTSEDVVSYRKDLGMSQTEFANYLSVGEASIKRWETYYVQDKVHDENIRLKCDKEYAGENAFRVLLTSHKKDIFRGNKNFNWDLFKNSVLFLVEVAKTPLYLNKTLFYLDFKHFQKYQVSITGSCYAKLEHGPCPDQFQILFEHLKKDGSIQTVSKYGLKANMKPDLALFDSHEKDTLNFIFKLAKKDEGKKFYQLSHEEKGYEETSWFDLISYEYSKYLKI